jgi:FkbM family methyltransferase
MGHTNEAKSMKKFVQGSLRLFGYEISRSRIRSARDLQIEWARTQATLINFLQTRNIDVVFDVGANEGQFGLSLRHEGYRGHIVSFEPIRTLFDVLKAHTVNDGAWEAHPVALGEAPAKASINVADEFSSLLPLRNVAAVFPQSAPARTEEITVATLDHFAPSFAGRNSFLKIDTQGYDRQVLLGAKATLATLQGIQLELPIVHIYSGVWRLADAINFMSEYGFVVAQMSPVACHPIDQVSWVEADCIFRRIDPRIDG